MTTLPIAERGELENIRRLRFSDGLERKFREQYLQQALGQMRFISGLLALLLAALGVALARHMEWYQTDVLVIYGLLAPLLLLVCLCSFLRQGRGLVEPGLAVCALLVGLFLILSFARVHSRLHTLNEVADLFGGYKSAMIAVIAFVYTVMRLRFLTATVVCWTVLAAYQVAASREWGLTLSHLMGADTLLFLINLGGMVANYQVEVYIRRAFLSAMLLEQERQKTERLMLSILPARIAERLKDQPGAIADNFTEVTVLFADIVDFTPLSVSLAPQQVLELLDAVFTALDHLVEKHGLEKIKTIGDAYMAVGGLPEERDDHADAVAAMALDILEVMKQFSGAGGQPLHIRIGINTGPVVAGVIGRQKFSYDLWGDTVNVASRMEAQGLPDEIHVSEETCRRLRDRFELQERGLLRVKGHGEVLTFLLKGRKDSYLCETHAERESHGRRTG